jgi:non-specific serine/threonine protein kinase
MLAASSSSVITADDLTPREAEVAALIARGYSQKRVAHELGISPHTINGYVQSVAARIPGNEAPRARIMIYFEQAEHSA